MESCLGKDNVNKYTVNLKKAVAKCQQQDAPELDLPPYRSMYKFVNTIINSADQMDQQKLHQVFVMLKNNKMDKFEMMKMMKDIMQENQYSDMYNKPQMMKMMKNFFGNDHSADEYNMMENFFRNKNNQKDMEFVEMMKNFFGNDHSADEYNMMENFF